MRDLAPLDGDVEELDGRGLCAVPGLVDCHTHPAFGGDRVEEFSLRAGRRDATRSSTRPAAGSSRPSPRRACSTRRRSPRGSSGTPAGCSRHGTTTWEGKSGYGLDRETELASLRAVRERRGLADLARRARGAAGARRSPTPTSTWRSPRCCRRRRGSPTPPTSSSSAARSTRAQARRYLEACRAAGLALRLHGDQFTECGAIPLAIELGARSVDHLEATGHDGVAALAPSDVVGVLLPASALFLDRPMPPARHARRRGRGGRARDRLQPRQLVHDEPPARLLARLHAAPSLARGGAHRGDRQRSARPRARADRVGRHRARVCEPTSSCSTRRDWRYLAYHLGGRRRRGGGPRRPGRRTGANLDWRCRPASSAAAARRTSGTSTRPSPRRRRQRAPARRR